MIDKERVAEDHMYHKFFVVSTANSDFKFVVVELLLTTVCLTNEGVTN